MLALIKFEDLGDIKGLPVDIRSAPAIVYQKPGQRQWKLMKHQEEVGRLKSIIVVVALLPLLVNQIFIVMLTHLHSNSQEGLMAIPI